MADDKPKEKVQLRRTGDRKEGYDQVNVGGMGYVFHNGEGWFEAEAADKLIAAGEAEKMPEPTVISTPTTAQVEAVAASKAPDKPKPK